MAWAARLCPTYVYPSEVTLFLDAGFDFVVINSQTGTEITIVMADACKGLDTFLTLELEKRNVVIAE